MFHLTCENAAFPAQCYLIKQSAGLLFRSLWKVGLAFGNGAEELDDNCFSALLVGNGK